MVWDVEKLIWRVCCHFTQQPALVCTSECSYMPVHLLRASHASSWLELWGVNAASHLPPSPNSLSAREGCEMEDEYPGFILLGREGEQLWYASHSHSRREPRVLLSACWSTPFQLPSWELIPNKWLTLIPLSYSLLLGESNPRQLPH